MWGRKFFGWGVGIRLGSGFRRNDGGGWAPAFAGARICGGVARGILVAAPVKIWEEGGDGLVAVGA